ncbi:RimK family protein [Sedimenticola selenatireducens]|uniref:RimK family protein n=1 Tax=Sedimenticola selenatireducens TaxID=191960 RepID=A0A558DNZ5_9GAMM|nr:RimK family protein [Sedimenticola selenatireducens]TVO78397.1 RimK family protein [Sedimenticola selenatireducens]TVT62744.1 MAG: RimK family protein [Sedimenticola selenatireducens]
MTEHLLLVEKASHWKGHVNGYPVVTAAEYLKDPIWQQKRGLRIVNLCRSQKYLGEGYYCSLLAEARGHKVIPSVRTLRDLSRKSLYSLETEDLDKQVQRILGRRHKGVETTSFSVTMMFGNSPLKDFQPLARELFELFRAPLMRIVFEKKADWRITGIKALGIQDLSDDQQDELDDALNGYLSKRWQAPRQKRMGRYDLAILQNPQEAMPPSDPKALKKFVRAAKKYGLDAELISPKDYGRLSEFDALFIRETTAIDHHTYRFARKAASEGLVVIDDPDSILRCTNKIYLEELLKLHRVSTPETVIVRSGGLDELEEKIAYPIVLKVPDGSFSLGVYKVENRQQLEQVSRKMFKDSDLLLGQAYTYTPFDWRVGIINRKPLYVCQYFMSKDHWQIYDHSSVDKEGDFRTFAIADAPKKVVDTALKAANLIGNGLYGVDLKETENGIVVIEVNDNPSIDSGVEDQVLGDALYEQIMEEFLVRIEAGKTPVSNSRP